jgi:hypothetical protein
MNLNQVTLPALVEDAALDETVRALRANGVQFTQEPRDEPWLWREGSVGQRHLLVLGGAQPTASAMARAAMTGRAAQRCARAVWHGS